VVKDTERGEINMAEEENTSAEESEEPTEEKKGSSKKKFIVIGAILLLLGGGGFAGWKFYFAEKFFPTGDLAMEEAEEAGADDAGVRIIHPMKPFIVNLLGDRGKRYLKTRVDIEVGDEAIVQEVGERGSELRDAILLLLASKSFDDISTPRGKVQLRSELMTRINETLKNGGVKALYFTEFVVQ